jgi:diguanylate cyclase (GGDEF)-like protein/PAS domain S-box-containing protein
MIYLFTPYTFVHFLTALISLGVMVLVWRRRTAPGGFQLFLFMVAIFEWSLAAGLESAAVDQTLKIFWSKIEYIGAHTSPVFLLLFILQYSGRDKWLTRTHRWMLFILPILTMVFAASNEWHGLIWSGFTPGPMGTNSLIYHHGWWFWVEIIYIYSLVFIAAGLLIRFALHSKKDFRYQNLILIIASIFPVAGSGIYILGLNPFPGLDLTPISFMFTGLALSVAFLYFQFMQLIPIARESLIDKMSDGVLVLDSQKMIVDTNPVARKIFKLPQKFLAGKFPASSLEHWEEISKCLIKKSSCRIELEVGRKGNSYIELDITPLKNNQNHHLGWLITIRDITQRKIAELKLSMINMQLNQQLDEITTLQEQLRDQANHDLITGIFNRRYLEDTLIREVGRARREKEPLSLVMIDMDNFKIINDRYGHQAGDRILQEVGKLLKVQIRLSDIACRYGGDEFVVIMPGASLEIASQRADAWRLLLTTMEHVYKGAQLTPTFSAGVATFPQHGGDPERLLQMADKALYRAKEAGRNRVVIA